MVEPPPEPTDDDPDPIPPLPLLIVADRDTKEHVTVRVLDDVGARRAAREFVRGFWADDAQCETGFAREIAFLDVALRDAVAEALEGSGVVLSVVDRDDAIDRVTANADAILDAELERFEAGSGDDGAGGAADDGDDEPDAAATRDDERPS